MPHLEGTWFYRTKSNLTSLSDKTGSFECIQSSEKNHGPVSISNTYHFKYSDGTPFYPFGTTCYAWIHQPKEVQEKTLASLKASPFNKIRMCVFPKWYEHSNPLVTHLSIQGDPWENGGVGEGEQKIDRWKMKYDKPVIIDEMKYEGNIRFSFGDLTAKEMTDRFWYTYTKGAYATHGETYIDDHDIIW